ncbi:MAG: TonB-dependent receptor [Croceibacterium sp.]
MKLSRAALLLSAAFLPTTPLAAQETPQSSSDSGASQTAGQAADGDDFHGQIVVTAGGLKRLDMLAGTSVVEAEDLQRNAAGQIGEILAKVPGVSASSFSPGASRPVLRGFSGDRVRVLQDGIGSIDASNTSADHAVTIDPLTAERIEVLRGPAVLLYGSSAIGGAVNVLDKRIPRRVPHEPVHVDVIAALDTAYDLREGGASIDVPLSGSVAFHVDGSYRTTSDLEIPGYAASAGLRAELLGEAAEDQASDPDHAAELVEAANIAGVLPGSATETWSLGSGLAWIGSGGSLGVSVSYFDTNYGVPERPGLGHHEAAPGEAEGVSIGLQQYRADLRGSLNLGDGFFEEATTRWGYSDYKHIEFEGDQVGTTFLVKGAEGRVELIQQDRGGWHGSVGGQFMVRDFQAIGDEAFVPANLTRSFALFTLQEVELDPFELEFGTRYERTDMKADTLGLKRGFDSISAALGLAYSPMPGLRLGLNGSRAARAPSAEELFANGPHIATQQYEQGNPGLRQETALGLEAYARATLGGADLGLSVYRTWFDDFVYLQATGAMQDDLPVYANFQQGADHFGVEAEASFPIYHGDGFTVVADLQGDYVRATLADGSPVPRMPPLSLLGALEWQSDQFDLRAEVQHFNAQDRIAAYETTTAGFTLTNLSVAWKPLRGQDNVTVMLQADNVFDVEGRRHASFTKDFVPMAGRNVKLSLRSSF